MRKSHIIIVFNSFAGKNVYFADDWYVCFLRAIKTHFPSYQNHSAVGEPIAIVYA